MGACLEGRNQAGREGASERVSVPSLETNPLEAGPEGCASLFLSPGPWMDHEWMIGVFSK